MTIKDRIRDLCREKGITVNKLETDLDLGIGYVSKLDKSVPNVKYLQMFSDYFDVSLDFLANGKEHSSTEYSTEAAKLVRKIRKDEELSEALLKYFELPEEKKKHIINTINMM